MTVLFVCAFVVMFGTGCWSKPSPKGGAAVTPLVVHGNVEISAKPIDLMALGPAPLPPLKKTRKNASVKVSLVEKWTVDAPWTSLQVVGLAMPVSTKVVLRTDKGKTYTSDIVGSAGGKVDYRFTVAPQDTENIVSVLIEADQVIHISDAEWYQFDAK